jgi:hypothetical protein
LLGQGVLGSDEDVFEEARFGRRDVREPATHFERVFSCQEGASSR